MPDDYFFATVPSRFWSRVQFGPGCWRWTGHTFPNGYGQICISHMTFSAHRVSWELNRGEIPGGLLVCHHCDVKDCVRPDHLFVGTALDNQRDCAAFGRGRSGERNGLRKHPEAVRREERHPRAKLTLAKIASARVRRQAGTTVAEMAAEFEVTPAALSHAMLGRTWKSIAPPT